MNTVNRRKRGLTFFTNLFSAILRAKSREFLNFQCWVDFPNNGVWFGRKIFEERRQMRRRDCAYPDVLFYELELGKNQMTGKCNTAKS